MTAVEWLVEQFEVSHSYINEIFKESIEQAKAMEKQQIIDAWEASIDNYGEYKIPDILSSEQYYNETYGSKGSDDTNVEEVPNPFLEGYEQINQNNPVTRGSTALVPISSQTEISDEEIEEMLFHHSNEYAIGFKDAIIWYREQLKQKQ